MGRFLNGGLIGHDLQSSDDLPRVIPDRNTRVGDFEIEVARMCIGFAGSRLTIPHGAGTCAPVGLAVRRLEVLIAGGVHDLLGWQADDIGPLLVHVANRHAFIDDHNRGRHGVDVSHE